MLYVCIPAHNEGPTIGLVLWKVRKLFSEFPREYELVVFNDGSNDSTAEVLDSYGAVLPLTVLGGPTRVGYARALDALARGAVDRCRYLRRDAVILLQGDLTDDPAQIPEFVKRFEGGADVVVGEAVESGDAPVPVRRLRRAARWIARTFTRVPDVKDPTGSFRLFRVSVLRDALRQAGESPLVSGEGWAANIDLLMATVPHARRVESIPQHPRFDLRPRPSRIRPLHDSLTLFRFGRSSRARASRLRLAERA